MTFPWWPDAITSLFKPGLAWSNNATVFSIRDFAWSLLTTGFGIYIVVLAGVGLLWAAIQRKFFAGMLLLWVIGMFLVANIGILKIPGSGFITNPSVMISLFLPISCLCGYSLAWLFQGWQRVIPIKFKGFYVVCVTVLLCVLALLAAPSILTILNPTTLLSRNADLSAIHWLDMNVPGQEPFLINSFSWGYGLYAGGDGGYWISALTSHPTIPPPVLYGLDYTTSPTFSSTSNLVIQNGTDPQELAQTMKTNHIRYLFTGVKGGAISAQYLEESPLFELIYSQDGASIFVLKK
jgi:hypothetical protein